MCSTKTGSASENTEKQSEPSKRKRKSEKLKKSPLFVFLNLFLPSFLDGCVFRSSQVHVHNSIPLHSFSILFTSPSGKLRGKYGLSAEPENKTSRIPESSPLDFQDQDKAWKGKSHVMELP